MLRKIILHGSLASFGEQFELDVRSPIEAVRALIVQLKGFRQALRNGEYRILKGDEALSMEELKLRLGRASEIHIVPVLAGSSSGWSKILVGVAIIALAIAAPYALGFEGAIGGALGSIVPGTSVLGFAGISYGTIAGIGAAIALSGVAQFLSPTQKPSANNNSYLFGSAQNVSTQGGPVPLVFGEFVTGSVVISVGLTTEEIGTDPQQTPKVILNDNNDPDGTLGGSQSLIYGH